MKRPLEQEPEVSSGPRVRPRLLESEVSTRPRSRLGLLTEEEHDPREHLRQELHPNQRQEVQEESEQIQREDGEQRRLQPYVEDDVEDHDDEYGDDDDVAIFHQIAEGLIAHDFSRSFLNNFFCGLPILNCVGLC
jgi:hypothetical protein